MRLRIGGIRCSPANHTDARQGEKDARGERQRAHEYVRDGEEHVGLSRLRAGDFLNDGPVGSDAEENLGAEERLEQDAPAAQVAHGAEAFAHGAAGPDHQEQDDYGADHVREDAECAVAEARAENQLDEDRGGGDQRKVADGRRAGIIEFGEFAVPPRARE